MNSSNLPSLNLPPSAKKAAELYMRAVMESNGLIRNCVTCKSFLGKEELCRVAMLRPPAKVIAYGCDAWVQEDNLHPLAMLPKTASPEVLSQPYRWDNPLPFKYPMDENAPTGKPINYDIPF
jgi:hypothetical protein